MKWNGVLLLVWYATLGTPTSTPGRLFSFQQTRPVQKHPNTSVWYAHVNYLSRAICPVNQDLAVWAQISSKNESDYISCLLKCFEVNQKLCRSSTVSLLLSYYISLSYWCTRRIDVRISLEQLSKHKLLRISGSWIRKRNLTPQRNVIWSWKKMCVTESRSSFVNVKI